MNEYKAIAGVYDRINSGVDYEKWADAIERVLKRELSSPPELVLDLACGTGRMTLALAKRGYDMIGVDSSAEMLMAATDSMYDMIASEEMTEEMPRPMFLCQDMKGFELYGTVGAVVCCLDSLNYLLEDGELQKCFDTVGNYLDTEGLFFFDMNTPYKFENVYGDNAYVYDLSDENEPRRFCAWQNYYDKETKLCDFYLTVFSEGEDGRYDREDEDQTERCYSMDEIKRALTETGFEILAVYDDLYENAPSDTCHRWYFVAKNLREHKGYEVK